MTGIIARRACSRRRLTVGRESDPRGLTVIFYADVDGSVLQEQVSADGLHHFLIQDLESALRALRSLLEEDDEHVGEGGDARSLVSGGWEEVSTALLALLVPQRPHLLLAAVALMLLIVLGGAVGLLLRPAFRVTTAGMEVRGYLSTRRLDWPEVAVIAIDRSVMNRGAVVIVARDGRRVTSALTGSRFALYRGESTFENGPDLLQPARPARAAIDTHRRWLHGAL
ncbi:hypothetical protein CFK38_09575 [Brachybacterium vulturis]|uniref:Low molecular weight protein antigen 6 PH domain-containing protein n=1 Tax=Brachybacterium vulturis TaxID=2017484 RepID=A0A291GND6_9MICO|nr:PH domain-containing protein [Brachybacterium vulturis]ATG51745.1 hypothetical protein CFK38_09575 [Brachybacterium vulturis]